MDTFDLSRVQQLSKYDCGAACIAMVTGVEVYTVYDMLGRDPADLIPSETLAPFYRLGVSVHEISRILYSLGMLHYVYDTREAYEGSWVHQFWDHIHQWNLPDVMNHLTKGGTAILGVDSKNVKDSHHWIVVDKCQVLDPSPGIKYSWGEPLPLIHAILIGEWCG